MLLNTYEAAATLTVGTDVFRNERLNVSSRPRVMRAIAIVGGATINEVSIDIYIEDFFVGSFRNSRTGVTGVVTNEDNVPVGPHMIPAGSKVSGIVREAPTTNPLIIQVH